MKLELETVCGHTIAKLPKRSKCILDIGGRDFEFAYPMAARGYEVYVVEPDSDVEPPNDINIHMIRTALAPSHIAGTVNSLVKWSTGEGNHLSCFPGDVPRDAVYQMTTTMSISQIHTMFKVDVWDIVKMDCEGAEYDALIEWPGPIARQITVEFHEHIGGHALGVDVYDKILAHLFQWYRAVQHNPEVRYCCHKPNYWDSLFILKSELGHD